MKITVLCGGISTEREVSIKTGTMVSKKLLEQGHQVILLDVYGGTNLVTGETAFQTEVDWEASVKYIEELIIDAEDFRKGGRPFFGTHVLDICKNSEIVFMALHGEDGENGKIQACFDLLGIRYTGTGCLGSGLAMDKNISKQIFLGNGVPTPEGRALHKDDKNILENPCPYPFPCVVKPCNGGSSVGVFMVENEKEYEQAIKEAFSLEEEILVERCIKGREFSVGVVDGQAYPVIEIAPVEGFYDFTSKYTANMAVETCPADLEETLTKQMQEHAKKAFEVLKLEAYARIDFLLDENNQMYCLEANTLPGMTATSLLPQEAAALGISFGELCDLLVNVSMKKYQ